MGRASAVAERNAFKSRLREILSDADARQISFEVIAVDDARARDKLHRRSLLTIKGGIAVEQGFQEFTNGKMVPVYPIDPDSHENDVRKFIVRENDLKTVWTLTVSRTVAPSAT